MAKNLAELEKELTVLHGKSKEQVAQLKGDLDAMEYALRPANLARLVFKDMFKSKTTQGIMGGAAGIAGTMLLNGLLKKPSALNLVAGLLTSQPVVDFLKEDKLGLGKLVDKIKSFVTKKESGQHGSEEDIWQ